MDTQMMTADELLNRLNGPEWRYQVHNPPRSVFVNGTECQGPLGCQCSTISDDVSVMRDVIFYFKHPIPFDLKPSPISLHFRKCKWCAVMQGPCAAISWNVQMDFDLRATAVIICVVYIKQHLLQFDTF